MRLLLLGGTTEARELSETLATGAAGPVEVILSLAGRTRTPAPSPSGPRIGGFGGPDGLAAYLKTQEIDLLIDATHPFAARMSANAVLAAEMTGVPLLRLVRPGWTARAGDRWTQVPTVAAAAERVAATAKRAFLTVGTGEIACFAACSEVFFLVRLIEPPATPLGLADHRLILDRGPFDLAGERRLMQENRIDALVTKNSGGTATAAKLEAARALEIPVIMVDRPAEPAARQVETVGAALDWIMDK